MPSPPLSSSASARSAPGPPSRGYSQPGRSRGATPSRAEDGRNLDLPRTPRSHPDRDEGDRHRGADRIRSGAEHMSGSSSTRIGSNSGSHGRRKIMPPGDKRANTGCSPPLHNRFTNKGQSVSEQQRCRSFRLTSLRIATTPTGEALPGTSPAASKLTLPRPAEGS